MSHFRGKSSAPSSGPPTWARTPEQVPPACLFERSKEVLEGRQHAFSPVVPSLRSRRNAACNPTGPGERAPPQGPIYDWGWRPEEGLPFLRQFGPTTCCEAVDYTLCSHPRSNSLTSISSISAPSVLTRLCSGLHIQVWVANRIAKADSCGFQWPGFDANGMSSS